MRRFEEAENKKPTAKALVIRTILSAKYLKNILFSHPPTLVFQIKQEITPKTKSCQSHAESDAIRDQQRASSLNSLEPRVFRAFDVDGKRIAYENGSLCLDTWDLQCFVKNL